ncbi:MAG: hypothetical protein GXO74_08885 [Calditrichaeota bacterium]|nr:hypothetical protein [Calditrichota bacterium]
MKKFKTQLIVSLAILWLVSCAAPPAMNDFFGVKMAPKDEAKFKITSYSQNYGASYTGTSTMEPKFYAYGEMIKNDLIIKITNETEQPVEINYQTDQFYIYTPDGKEFVLRKPQIDKYPSASKIKPGKAVQFKLMLPSDFWRSVGMTAPNTEDAKLVENFWKGLDQQNFSHEKIKKIKILLAGKTLIVMKPLPKK